MPLLSYYLVDTVLFGQQKLFQESKQSNSTNFDLSVSFVSVPPNSNFNHNEHKFQCSDNNNHQPPIGNHKFLDNRINQTNMNTSSSQHYNDLIHDMNSHLNFTNSNNVMNSTSKQITKPNGNVFHPVSQQQQQQPEPAPTLNRTKSSKLLESLSSVATTIFKPKTQKHQEASNYSNHGHSQLFNETGAPKNVRLINQADHPINQYANNNVNNNNNSMDICSVPSPSLSNGLSSQHSAFHNYNNMNADYTGK